MTHRSDHGKVRVTMIALITASGHVHTLWTIDSLENSM
jgi:hypothetical protein